MDEKDYRYWFPLKRKLHNSNVQRPFVHQREIWFCHLGENIGFEEDGKGKDFLRPVLVFRKFNNEIFWGIPLTRTIKHSPHYFVFTPELRDLAEQGQSAAMLSQIRLIDAKRLLYVTGRIASSDFLQLKRKFKALLP